MAAQFDTSGGPVTLPASFALSYNNGVQTTTASVATAGLNVIVTGGGLDITAPADLNSLVLDSGAAAFMEIDKATGTSDLVQGLTSVTYGGTLNVTNLAGTPALDDTFTLFSAASYAGSFAAFNLPSLPAALTWDTSQLAVNGSIRVTAADALAAGLAPATYGGTATATATLTTLGGAPLPADLVSFSLGGISVGTATTNASGMATLTSISLAGYNATTYTSALVVSYGGISADADLVVSPAPLAVTANPQTKQYGQNDPTLSYAVSGYQNGDNSSIFTGKLGRAAGQNVGGYAIGLGTLSAGNNYTIGFTGNNLSITPTALDVTATAETKSYGQADPALGVTATGYQYSDNASNVLSGNLTRAGRQDSRHVCHQPGHAGGKRELHAKLYGQQPDDLARHAYRDRGGEDKALRAGRSGADLHVQRLPARRCGRQRAVGEHCPRRGPGRGHVRDHAGHAGGKRELLCLLRRRKFTILPAPVTIALQPARRGCWPGRTWA